LIIVDIEDWLLADEYFGSTAKAYGERSFTNGKVSIIIFNQVAAALGQKKSMLRNFVSFVSFRRLLDRRFCGG
jgi:hypothetical protein